jgi:hypothetical protein
MGDRATLRAMEGFDRAEAGSTTCYLDVAGSHEDYDGNERRHCMSKARDSKKPNDKKKAQKTLKEKRQSKREKKLPSPRG